MIERATMKKVLMWGVCVGTLGGCSSSESLVNSGTYPQIMVGARRVAPMGATTFSDYVFGQDGSLAHLRSVDDGKIVDAAQGAGNVRGVDGVACRFGTVWYGVDADTLVIDGQCSDGAAREIALDLTQISNAQQTAEVGAAWMTPTSWRIQRCDLHACAD